MQTNTRFTGQVNTTDICDRCNGRGHIHCGECGEHIKCPKCLGSGRIQRYKVSPYEYDGGVYKITWSDNTDENITINPVITIHRNE